ncbi:hypothetical protein H5J24_06140 [Chryseobacterium capnotolerans]|uniref:hypothetical protein n=1 Tax=Chryseobacterium TaxID=59732 RepID=UPI001144F21F|nr:MULTISPECIES: hypothetical protein [Chryseobacterium]UHO39654.1 hypothetical protein H5J24_06140 [Chryseobacterium capnotolerans]
MKKLNPSYFKFFFYRYGVIIIFVHIVTTACYFLSTQEEDPITLIFPTILCFIFFPLICLSEYRMLEKNLPPANVFLTDHGLIINKISYPAEQIKEITYMPVRNTLNKFSDDFFEIETNDGAVFYFLDKSPNWKFESPTMKLLNNHPLFSSKTKKREESSDGFSVFKKQKQS